ncbi:hypothetical protein RS130_00740 [Paraglaciecola aquimarina]|uniref:Uncharacterized protein n=1 Tax=Paraglaciecola aquimarina TaxID=1235557 RepID=A0ABU3SRM1_9ALTE|nr:hypothetical protein [Paraglaciecola aquimarina]MDU0352638.1 hypothetical protein [Paraglaciecola aquimarina]
MYGFVNVLEALKKETPEIELPDFDAHVERLVASIDKLLGDDVVPHWDYFAIEENAASIAANQSTSTYRFSRILDLCDFLIDDYILPYIGYGPIFIDKDIQ